MIHQSLVGRSVDREEVDSQGECVLRKTADFNCLQSSFQPLFTVNLHHNILTTSIQETARQTAITFHYICSCEYYFDINNRYIQMELQRQEIRGKLHALFHVLLSRLLVFFGVFWNLRLLYAFRDDLLIAAAVISLGMDACSAHCREGQRVGRRGGRV